jgi:hypothetical protein
MRLLKKVLNSAGIHARYRSASENSRLLTTPTLAVGFCFNFQTCVHRPGGKAEAAYASRFRGVSTMSGASSVRRSMRQRFERLISSDFDSSVTEP